MGWISTLALPCSPTHPVTLGQAGPAPLRYPPRAGPAPPHPAATPQQNFRSGSAVGPSPVLSPPGHLDRSPRVSKETSPVPAWARHDQLNGWDGVVGWWEAAPPDVGLGCKGSRTRTSSSNTRGSGQKEPPLGLLGSGFRSRCYLSPTAHPGQWDWLHMPQLRLSPMPGPGGQP